MNLEGTNIQNASVMSNSEKSLQIALPTINSDNLCQSAEDVNNKTDTHMLQSIAKEESNDASHGFNDQKDSYIINDAPVRNEDENSQDSLLQHMQDM